MGKKRVIKKSGDVVETAARARTAASKRKLTHGIIHIYSTYNNTMITLTDQSGNVVLSGSSGRSGFSGSKKGTPYAATKAAEVLADQAREMGMQDADIRVKGVGSGRESALRTFIQKGFAVHSIKDMTPTPHGYPRPAKPRRV
ncbi:MAG: 30S ribosomal protein S11 [Candidatus Ryanbacteria bacterium]|nr:30S ribosomal protein S11 [Candidatus Ryanbacteria bacterium]